jgi:hypothetical protein
MDMIAKHVNFKPGSLAAPKNYLGADVSQINTLDRNQATPRETGVDYVHSTIYSTIHPRSREGTCTPRCIFAGNYFIPLI